MREQRHAAAAQALLQRALFQQAVDAELQSSSSAKACGWWKSGLPGGWRSAQYEMRPSTCSMTALSARTSFPG